MTLRPLLILPALFLLAGTAAAQERQWTLNASDQDAYLIFGVPESDDVGISMWCSIKTGVVNVFVPEAGQTLAANKTVSMTLEAGTAKASFKGKTEVNEEAGNTSLEAEVPADHPIFAAIAKADRLRVRVGKDETVFPLFDADVPGLLALCRKG